MDRSLDQQKLISSIEEEYKQISTSFFHLSQLFSDLSKENIKLDQLPISLTTFTKKEEISTSSQQAIQNGKEEVKENTSFTLPIPQPIPQSQLQRRRTRGKQPKNAIIPNKQIKMRRRHFNPRIKTYCKLEGMEVYDNGKEIVAYKIHVRYNELIDIIGPYKESKFANLIKNHLQRILEKLDHDPQANDSIVKQCITELKSEIYSKYPFCIV